MKISLNVLLVGSLIGLFIWWNNFSSQKNTAINQPNTPAEESKTTPVVSWEQSLAVALDKNLPQQFLIIQHLLENHKLPIVKGYNVDYIVDEQDSEVLTDIVITNQSNIIKYHFELGKEEAFYKTDKNNYPFDVIVTFNNKVVLQFNGHLDRNKTPAEYIDLDVVAYESGDWEKMIQPFGNTP